jgi:signal transduction histidine kinase
VNRLRTVGLKLTLALAGLVAGALAIVYLAVVPSLEDRLIEGRQNELKQAAEQVIREIEQTESPFLSLDEILSVQADEHNARLTVFTYLDETPVFLVPGGDSVQYGAALREDPVAQTAAERRTTERGVVERDGNRFAEVAVPFGGRILLLGSRIDEGTIALVERRLLLAGVAALLLAAIAGFVLARLHARRIRRLERAAGRIAAGRFDEPVVDTSRDELGELATAFDDMRKRLAALERARREFIANASHELRTPIFALGGHIELLTDEDVDPATQLEFLGEMRAQVERLTKLATDLLDLSRLDAGRLRIELAPVDLNEVAASLVGEFRGVGRGSEHGLEASGDGTRLALADEERVRQIGRILVENAIVHTPPGTNVRVSVGGDASSAALTIEDDGPGIRRDERDQVFERFYRSDTAVKAGSGLGLAIARELAEIMGGDIELESRAGRTVFTLRLPRAHVREDERAPVLTG